MPEPVPAQAGEPRVVLTSGGVTSPAGFLAGGVAAGIKASGALDLGILASERPALVAAVFTQHALPAPPVVLTRERVARGRARAVIVNSGNANAATGAAGLADARAMARLLAERLSIPEEEALVASTGIIGVRLPLAAIAAAVPQLPLAPDGGHAFARAILTTDTRPKEAAVRLALPGRTVTIGGCAKGAGMIHPNLATMLAFFTTDAPLDLAWLQATFRQAVDDTFNLIDVDGDTSTNDTVLLLANGLAGGPPIAGGEDGALFAAGLRRLAEHLARAIVQDAEGATKLIEVRVSGAPSRAVARAIARTVASSLMVKTAVHGNDPNWGRIYGAAGNAGVPIDERRLTIAIGNVLVFRHGQPQDYNHPAAVAALQGSEVVIALDLGAGSAAATAWGCNLSEQYVTLNSVYTT